MYFWKCWRNSRARFGTYLILVSLACAVVIGIMAKMGGPTGFQKGPYGTGVWGMWAFGGRILLGGVLAIIILFGALSLAAGVIGEEFKEQTLGFLFTRPRPRWVWVWTSWLMGGCELLVVVLSAVVGVFAGLTYLSGYVYTWRLLAAILPLFVGALLVYTMGFFLTAVSRSGENGFTWGAGILMVDLLLPLALYYWHYHLSSVLDVMHDGCGWAVGPPQAFPWRLLIICLALTCALLLGTQVLIERREV
jgi:ABC-type transport system involved in multi-copper enzyme maturation permease subunit